MGYWTAEQEESLRQLAIQDLTTEEIGKILGKTERAIGGRLHRLRIVRGRNKNWSQDELDALRSLWPTNTQKQISAILGRTPSAIQKKSFLLKLPIRRTCPTHTITCQVCNILIENVPFGQKYCKPCSIQKVKDREKAKLRGGPPRANLWSQERTDRLLFLRKEKNLSAGEIAKELNLTKNSIIGKLHRLGVYRPTSPEVRSFVSKLGAIQTNRKKRRAKPARIAPPPKPKPKVKLPIMRLLDNKVPALNPLEVSPIHLVQIKNGQCKFIEGDDRMCCGRKALNGFSWCPHHYARAHVLDRRSASMAYFYQQPVAHSQGQKHNQPELQEMDRRSPDRAGPTEGEVSFW